MASFRIVEENGRVRLAKAWTIAGYVLVCGMAIFVGRMVYEETILTWRRGPQMVGFAVMHGGLPVVLMAGFIALPGTLIWLAVSVVHLIRRKFRVSAADWMPAILLLFLMALLFIPYEAWEELMVRIAGPGSHASDFLDGADSDSNCSDFLVQAAAQDRRRFVGVLLREGCDVNYENGGGTTPLSGASVGGHEEMVSLLVSKGADVNRRNRLSGETPLMAAAEIGQFGTKNFAQ